MWSKSRSLVVTLAALGLPVSGNRAEAGVITFAGLCQAGITNLGNLYDPVANVGFRRISDGYDPIAAGGREVWGVRAGGTSGYVQSGVGVNILPGGTPVFGPDSARITTFLNAGLGNVLHIEQVYFGPFAKHCLAIDVTITNVSGVSQAVTFRRVVDWDIAPTPGVETSTAVPRVAPVSNASFSGLESADPLVPFANSTGAGGGTFGPGDLGAGLDIDVGTLQPGASARLHIVYALNRPGQQGSDLALDIGPQAVAFFIEGASTDAGRTNFAALGTGLVAIPEPSSLVLVGLVGGGLFVCRRRQNRTAPTRVLRFARAAAAAVGVRRFRGVRRA